MRTHRCVSLLCVFDTRTPDGGKCVSHLSSTTDDVNDAYPLPISQFVNGMNGKHTHVHLNTRDCRRDSSQAQIPLYIYSHSSSHTSTHMDLCVCVIDDEQGDEEYSQPPSAIHGRFEAAAICIQRLVSSRESASHDTCRTSLRPSSITKPRYPSLSVVSLIGWQGSFTSLVFRFQPLIFPFTITQGDRSPVCDGFSEYEWEKTQWFPQTHTHMACMYMYVCVRIDPLG